MRHLRIVTTTACMQRECRCTKNGSMLWRIAPTKSNSFFFLFPAGEYMHSEIQTFAVCGVIARSLHRFSVALDISRLSFISFHTYLHSRNPCLVIFYPYIYLRHCRASWFSSELFYFSSHSLYMIKIYTVFSLAFLPHVFLLFSKLVYTLLFPLVSVVSLL